MNLKKGALLKHGEYRIEDVLGQGGFGITYLAVQIGLNRKVAVKEFFMSDFCYRDASTFFVGVPSDANRDKVYKCRDKFIREALNIARLDNPHIIRIYDVFEENGTAYYVMEHIDGKSLGEVVRPGCPLSEDVALEYITQLSDALSAVHANNLLHLDVKPGNIMVSTGGRIVLIDFGVSKSFDDSKTVDVNETEKAVTTTLLGYTPGYAPPEQMDKNATGLTPAADVYALGATLYKMLSGTSPLTATMRACGKKVAPLPASVSPSVCKAIDSAMQMDAEKRLQSVGEFLALLKGTPPPQPPKKSNKWLLLVGVFLILGILAAVFWYMRSGDGGKAVVSENTDSVETPKTSADSIIDVENSMPTETEEPMVEDPVVENPVAEMSVIEEPAVTLPPAKNNVPVERPSAENDPVKDVVYPAKGADAEALYSQGKKCYDSAIYSEAATLYRKAAEQGHAGAQLALGFCYKNGQGVDPSSSEAIKWWSKAAEQGYAAAQYNLGLCYDKGYGVNKNSSTAVEWWLKSAVQGYADAQYNLGACYAQGEGALLNQEEAVKWYRKAAEQGHAGAQCGLGTCYRIGFGVNKDTAEAVKWYRKAAEQGHENAKVWLTLLGESY
jgi:TPR repeat protein